MSNNNGSKTLIGRESIMQYLEIGRPMFDNFIKMGMPARVISNRWYAHRDNIDEFFKRITRHREKDLPDDAQ